MKMSGVGGAFGYRTSIGSNNHRGIDFSVNQEKGIPIFSTVSGTVVVSQAIGERGNTIVIQSDENPDIFVLFQHLANDTTTEVRVKSGWVNIGDKIGIVGDTGLGGIHLHYEVLINPTINRDENGKVTSISQRGAMNPWLFLP